MLVKVEGSKDWIESGKIQVRNDLPVMTKKQQLSVGNTVSANKWLSGTEEPVLGWESSKPDVANVAEDGTVTILKSGKAKIYPVFPFGRSKAGTTVTVKKVTGIERYIVLSRAVRLGKPVASFISLVQNEGLQLYFYFPGS